LSAFSYFDKDGSGCITIDEIQAACKEFGLDDVHIDEMVKEVDQNNVSIFFFVTVKSLLLLAISFCKLSFKIIC
jgi:Ca2+-binding EF-hand superfamily protein